MSSPTTLARSVLRTYPDIGYKVGLAGALANANWAGSSRPLLFPQASGRQFARMQHCFGVEALLCQGDLKLLAILILIFYGALVVGDYVINGVEQADMRQRPVSDL